MEGLQLSATFCHTKEALPLAQEDGGKAAAGSYVLRNPSLTPSLPLGCWEAQIGSFCPGTKQIDNNAQATRVKE